MGSVIFGAKYYSKGEIKTGKIFVSDGTIARIYPPNLLIDLAAGTEIIYYSDDAILFPGLVDLHVHLREPGFSYKETIKTGTKAAARGGVTTLVTMPNLNPAPDSLENLQQQIDLIERDAVVNVLPTASITVGQKGAGELVDFAALADKVIGFSDDGRGVQSEELMREAMRQAAKVNRAIIAHCEVDDLLHGGYIHDGEYAKANNHRGICSDSEWAQVKRDIEIIESLKREENIDVQYHVCHISTKESVALIRAAKAKGLRVSCETAPHYLLLTDCDLQENGRFKMNPPIRSAEDRAALIEGLKDGTIDVIATDHAPHSAEEKSRGLENSAFGVVGIETSFATLYTHLVLKNVITLERLVDAMSTRPRELFGLPKVEIEEGMPADLVAFDLNEKFKIDPAEFMSLGKATPLEGLMVQGRTKMTMVAGKVVYNEK
ncbi:MAG: dihydroorotase [Rikenellaceae bacterium]